MTLRATWLSGRLEPANYLLSISFAVADCDKRCSQLQVVQVFYGSGRQQVFPPGVRVHAFDVGTGPFEGFVDRSPSSPAVVMHDQAPGHKTKPYYYGPRELRRNASGCHITVYDQPLAVQLYRDAYFETAIVCVDLDHTGADRILKILRWGWSGNPGQPASKSFWPSAGAQAPPADRQPVQAEAPGREFRNVLRYFYPDYEFTVRRGAL